MADTERMRGIIDIEVLFRELDFLLAELQVVERAVERLDDKEIDIDVDLEGLERTFAEAGLLKGVTGGGGRRGTGVPDVSDAAGGAAAAGGGFLDNLFDANLKMEDLHNAMAKLVPLILVIIGALPALIAGIVGLAAAAVAATAALFGLAGFGALGFAMVEGEDMMEGFKEILDTIKEDFLDAFTPLAKQLAPLFRDALDGLGKFFQNLADQGDALLMFEQVARSFGAFLVRELPSFIAFLADMARAFEPVFSAIAAALFDSNLGEGFMQFMADVMPALMDFGALIAAVLPDILRMSIGFLKVTNALLLLLEVFFIFIDILPITDEFFGFLVATLLTLTTAILLAKGALWAFTKAGIVGALSSMKMFATQLYHLIGLINSYTATTWGAVLANLALITVITLGLGTALIAASAAVSTMSSKFDSLTGSVNGASGALRNFDRTTSRMDGPRSDAFGPSTTAGQVPARSRRGGTTINVEGNADRETMDDAITKLAHRDK